MNKRILLFAACLSLFASIAGAQVRKPAPPTAFSPEPAPGYTFLVDIQADGSLDLKVLTGYEADLNKDLLRKALTEYVQSQQPGRGQRTSGPTVFIRPATGSLAFRTVSDVIKASRVSPSTEVRIELPEGPTLLASPDPRFERNTDMRPNPLYLLVALANDGGVKLNNEPVPAAKLGKRLKDIFDDRSRNGVVLPDTGEVEKTVYLTIPLSAKIDTLVDIAKILGDAGADPIILQVDSRPEPPTVPVRK